ncbi:MAG TPA: hypothetical protein ENN17_02940 [bacterium]|nr:hypothetical protein [bacterium]
MFGLGDFWVSAVFLLMILSTVLCVIYGALNWNKGGETSRLELMEEKRWSEEEKKIEDTL